MTLNLVFKVMPFFNTEYLTNGYRYGHSYYRRRIGNAPKLSNGTSFNDSETNPDLKVTVLFNVKKNSKVVQGRAIFTMADQ